MHSNNIDEEKKLLFESEGHFHRGLMKEFKVDEEYVRQGVEIIMDWYREQPHLPKYAMDFDLIERIFSQCKYSIEKAKQKLDCFLSIRGVMPEYFIDRDPRCERVILSTKYTECVVMPKLTPEGYRVTYFRYPNADTDFYDPVIGYKMLFMICDLRLFCDKSCGDIFIWDSKNISLGHLTRLTPTILKKTTFIFNNAYATRIKAMHIINLPKYSQNFITFWKTLMTKKIASRLHFHSKIEDMYKFISPEYLPGDSNGTSASGKEVLDNMLKVMQADDWREWYLKSGKEVSDESKRPTKTNTYDEFLGVSGTFRKLTID